MKILLVGASSDICCKLFEKYNKKYEFIRLSSNEEFSDVSGFNVLDPSTFLDLDNLYGIVYFPGTIILKPFKRLDLDVFKSDYEINVLGLLNILKFYESRLSESASLVFISTVAASLGMPFHSSISMCKSSIEALSRTLSAEWAPKIRVNCIAPSLVNTKLANRFFRNEKQIELMNERHPLKRTGNTDDISNAIEFLLSPNSSWITGQVINVDGGMSTLKL